MSYLHGQTSFDLAPQPVDGEDVDALIGVRCDGGAQPTEALHLAPRAAARYLRLRLHDARAERVGLS